MANLPIYFRRSEARDMRFLMEINHLIWNDTNSPFHLNYHSQEEYEHDFPAGSQVVAVLNQKVVGFGGYQLATNIDSNNHVVELMIGVHPKYHGKKIGKQLMHYLEKEVRNEGKRKISLRVLETNRHAIRFYQRLGYKIQGRLPQEFMINDKYVDDILMYKIL